MKFPALMPPKPETPPGRIIREGSDEPKIHMTSTTGHSISHIRSHITIPQKKRKHFFRTVYNSLAREIDRPSVLGLTLVFFLVITSPVWVPPHLTYKIFNIIRDALAE